MKYRDQILIAISIFATVFVNYPLISVANKSHWFLGVPVLYWYLLICCSCIIGCIYFITVKKNKSDR